MNEHFIPPEDFARKLGTQASDSELPVRVCDPHLTSSWFQLLAETAMPIGARLALCDIGCRSYLPLMLLPDQPGRLLALSNFYTPLFAPINESMIDPTKLQVLAHALRTRLSHFHEIRLAPMDPESPVFARLHDAFAAAGWWVDDYFCFGNWYYPVETRNYADYLANRPSRLRNTIQRATRKLDALEGYELTILDGSQFLETGIADFVSVYNRSWKNPEPFPEFIPGLCRMSALAGWLRLGLIRISGQPIAAQLWLVVAGKAHIVKLSYDQAYVKTSAGTVLTAAMMKRVIDVDRVDEIDYLTGDDEYKQDWMSCRRERRGLIGFNPLFVKGVQGALRHTTGKLKRQILGTAKPLRGTEHD